MPTPYSGGHPIGFAGCAGSDGPAAKAKVGVSALAIKVAPMSAIRIIFNWGSSDRLSLPINYGRVAAPMAANSEIGVIAAIPHRSSPISWCELRGVLATSMS
jgi:hypothetical protein